MRDARVGTSGTTFSQLYAEIKEARDVDRLAGGKVLYLKDGNAESAFFSATKFWAGRAGRKALKFTYDTIRTEYGAKVAKRVFRQVMSQAPPGYQDEIRKISLDKLSALKNALSYERKLPQYRDKGIKPATFTKMREDVGSLKKKRERQGKGDFEPGKHLRFTAEKNLYVHTKWSTGFKNWFFLQTSRQDKRAAAGSAIWKAIVQEHSEGTAERVFCKVFGANAFHASGADHKIAVTMRQFKKIETEIDDLGAAKRSLSAAKKFLDTMKHTKKASPLDALTALFGPPQDIGTKAALDRLRLVAPKGVVQTLRQQPKALLDYVKDKNWLVSFLERAPEKVVDDDAKNDIVDMHGALISEPEKEAVKEIWAAVFGCRTFGANAFNGQLLGDQTITDQRIRALIVTARLNDLIILVKPKIPARQCLWSDEKGITGSYRHTYRGEQRYMYPHLSVADIRAYDDLLLIRKIVHAAENGEINLNKESRDMLTRRTTEIRTEFETLLEKKYWTPRDDGEALGRILQKQIDKVMSDEPAGDNSDVTYVLRGWYHAWRDAWTTQEALWSVEHLLSGRQDPRPEDLEIVGQLQTEMGQTMTLKEIHHYLETSLADAKKVVSLKRKAYQEHDWTKSMVKKYGHLGFRDDLKFFRKGDFSSLMRGLPDCELRQDTFEAVTRAVEQAELLEKQMRDAWGLVDADPEQTQNSNNAGLKQKIIEPPQPQRIEKKIDFNPGQQEFKIDLNSAESATSQLTGGCDLNELRKRLHKVPAMLSQHYNEQVQLLLNILEQVENGSQTLEQAAGGITSHANIIRETKALQGTQYAGQRDTLGTLIQNALEVAADAARLNDTDTDTDDDIKKDH